MSTKVREIESKWHSTESIDELRTKLEESLGSKRAEVVASSGTDTYWNLGESAFVRIRPRTDGSTQLTVKRKDRGTNLNRVEIDLSIKEDQSHVMKFMQSVHGSPAGNITKAYWVYWIKGEDEHTNLSLYTVKGYAGTFIECEASTKAKLSEIEEKYLTDLGELTSELRSLYEIFILPAKERFTI
jgi:hypothetical protein